MAQETTTRRWATPAAGTPADSPGAVDGRDCLSGGGEMGALMRSLDWRRTLVGPVDEWPQSLRTSVSIMLASRFPMAIGWGRDYVFMYNDGYRPILGANKHPSAMGSRTLDVFPEIGEFVGQMFGKVMTGEAVGFEDLLLPLDRNGFIEDCYFTFSYSPIRDETGGVGGVLVTVTETTPRVLGERRLSVLRDLAASSTDAKSVEEACVAAMRVLRGSADLPAARLFLGTGDQLRCVAGGDPTADTDRAVEAWRRLAIVDSDTTHDVRDQAADLFPDLVPQDRPRDVLSLTMSRSGQVAGVLVAAANPRLALDADYESFFGLVRDQVAAAMNDAHAYEAERRRAEALAEVDRAKTVFFSNVSHEFRTPLTLMLGPAEDALADAEQPLSPAQRERIETVHRNALRLEKLVNALLDFSRIEAGRIEAVYEPSDLARLTAELASVFRSAIERAGLTLDVRCDPLPGPAYVDRDMWEKIVLNLLSNALKFTLQGSIAVEQTVEDDSVVLRVSDTGTGIAPSELPRIFERFHRVKGARARTHEGSGIGLALVHELVRLHGGSIEATSTPGVGTTMSVRIPLGTAHLPADRIAVERSLPRTATGAAPFVTEALRWLPDPGPHEVAQPASPPPGGCVLVVDDNADMRSYLERLLSQRWRVEVAADGISALERIRRDPPDAILTDVMLPGLDGFELLREVRRDEATKRIPVVMLSARAGEEATLEALAAGADDYLVKPFSARELFGRLDAQLESSRARDVEERLRSRLYDLFMQAPAVICVLRGPQHVYEMVNPRYQALFPGRRLLGLPIREALPELEGQGFLELLDGVYTSGEPYAGEAARALLEREGQLVEKYFTFIYQPWREDGAVIGVLVFAFDTTEQVRARRELEEADRRKDEFLAMLSHELRNPLAPVTNAIEVLDRIGSSDPRAVELRRIIVRQTGNLSRLVEDLLDISRLRTGKVTLQRRVTDLRDVVQSSVETFRLGRGGSRAVTLALPSASLPADVDPVRMEQVIGNLLDNAAKFTPPNGSITVSVAKAEGAAEVRVKDTGRGIPREMLERIFEIFVQGETSLDRGSGGLGLGLALVRGIVERQGGSVVAHSAGPGTGAEFIVRMPLVEALAAAAEPTAQNASKRRRIVVVEDNADARLALAALLELDGHDVRVAADGATAVAAILADPPDVAFVDIGLPLLDGYEVARAVRQSNHQVQLVALTGYGQAEDRTRAREAGFDTLLVKPVDARRLAEVLSARLPHR